VEIRFSKDGSARAIYGEEIDLEELGVVKLRRASRVEPTSELSDSAREWLYGALEELSDHMTAAKPKKSLWWADMIPMNGPVLGPFNTRSAALKAEVMWLNEHGLLPAPDSDKAQS
jgi:hypothetical protein